MVNRKDSTLKDIMDVTTMLPWWVGMTLAVIAYFLFHYLAGIQIEQVVDKKEWTLFFVKKLGVTFSVYLQYIIPGVILFGVIKSLFHRSEKNALYGRLKHNPELRILAEMNWQQFELLVGKYFENRGYSVRQLAQPGPDGGVDLVAVKDSEKYLVQCKQWRSTSVGVKVVRELMGIIVANGAVGGFVVASGKFTSNAKEFAIGRNIELIDGLEIVNEIGAVDMREIAGEQDKIGSELSIPNCLKCGSPMVLRTAKKGVNAGGQFFGCSAFPKCKNTRSL